MRFDGTRRGNEDIWLGSGARPKRQHFDSVFTRNAMGGAIRENLNELRKIKVIKANKA
jgi:hypothetical protein